MKPLSEKEKNIEAAASAAAEWWGCACADPRFDNGDNSKNGAITMILAALNHSLKPPASTEKLVDAIRAYLVERTSLGYASLSTDYGPDYKLRTLAGAAGFHGDFPWKTLMTISPDAVFVACGDRAPLEKIWSHDHPI